MRKQILAAAIAALTLPCAAVAHEAGDVILRVGIAHSSPSVSGTRVEFDGVKESGYTIGIKSDTQVGLTATYMVMPHFGLEVMGATPFTHKITMKHDNITDKLDIGKVSLLPYTVSAQYFFLNPKSKFQPYVGLGLNYTIFYNAKLSNELKEDDYANFKMNNSFGLAAQVGTDYKISERFLLNAAIWKIGMTAKGKMRDTYFDEDVKIKANMDPWVYFLGVGYKF